MLYLLVYVLPTVQELVRGLLMRAASHGALLEEQRVQLTDRFWTLCEVIYKVCLVNCHLVWSKRLWMKVHYGHGAALCAGPHCDLPPVTPSVEQQAGLQRRLTDEVLVAPGYQFVLLRHVEQMVSIDADNCSRPAGAHIKPHSLWVSIDASIYRERGLVAVAVPDWRWQDRQDRERKFASHTR